MKLNNEIVEIDENNLIDFINSIGKRIRKKIATSYEIL